MSGKRPTRSPTVRGHVPKQTTSGGSPDDVRGTLNRLEAKMRKIVERSESMSKEMKAKADARSLSFNRTPSAQRVARNVRWNKPTPSPVKRFLSLPPSSQQPPLIQRRVYPMPQRPATTPVRPLTTVSAGTRTGARLVRGLASGMGDFTSVIPGIGLAVSVASALPQLYEEAKVADYNRLTGDQRAFIDRTHYDLVNPFSPDRWFLPDWWKSGVDPSRAVTVDDLPLGEFVSTIPRFLPPPQVPAWFRNNVNFIRSKV